MHTHANARTVSPCTKQLVNYLPRTVLLSSSTLPVAADLLKGLEYGGPESSTHFNLIKTHTNRQHGGTERKQQVFPEVVQKQPTPVSRLLMLLIRCWCQVLTAPAEDHVVTTSSERSSTIALQSSVYTVAVSQQYSIILMDC